MSEEKKKYHVIPDEEMPEWAKDLPDVQNIIQGMSYTFSGCIHAKGESIADNSPIGSQEQIDKFKAMDPKVAMLEVICGILTAWLGHQCNRMPPHVFNATVASLPETIAGALHQIGIVKLAGEEKTNEIMGLLEERFKKDKGISVQDYAEQQVRKMEGEFSDSELESAVDKLKRIGKGLLH